MAGPICRTDVVAAHCFCWVQCRPCLHVPKQFVTTSEKVQQHICQKEYLQMSWKFGHSKIFF
jgi:hypothetical protein